MTAQKVSRLGPILNSVWLDALYVLVSTAISIWMIRNPASLGVVGHLVMILYVIWTIWSIVALRERLMDRLS